MAGRSEVRLRDVTYSDVDSYVRMRCDPVMTAELGGPQPREGIEEKVSQDAVEAAAGTALIKMIIPDVAAPEVVAGSVVLWPSHGGDGQPISEIGWMVLPEFQGRGIGKQAVRMLLEVARDENRWGLVHAFPATTNAPSNALCRSVGFRFAGQVDIPYADRVFRTNHWIIDPRTDPA
jgi:RimJ/RimL family protein N-acetyltransferase